MNKFAKYFFIICIISLFSQLKASADEYLLSISGENLSKISALKISLDISPNEFCTLDEEINISNSNIAFKSVNKQGSFIIILFNNPKDKLINEINIHGKINRNNYGKELEVAIKGVNYIARFAKEVDHELIKSKIKIIKKDEQLPFYGISKADILGPNPRIFSKSMLISIGNIETYGFNLNKTVKNIKINDKEAELINDKIIIANLDFLGIPESGKIPINLSLDVAGKTVKKSIDTINLLDAIDLN